jgi:DNA-directed RNA polymerase subunit beta'
VDEIQEVYRLQGVNINDKHIEVVVRQMMRWVKIEEVEDTEFLIDEVVDKIRFISKNERISSLSKKPSAGRPLLLGITKASLSTDSFISAASFQETTRVLTEAAISGKVDYLRGLKEKAGTGMEYYRRVKIPEGDHRASDDGPRGRDLRGGVPGGAGAHQGRCRSLVAAVPCACLRARESLIRAV